MLDYLLLGVAGVLSGIVAGLIPGIGVTAMMAMVGMFFITEHALDIVMFYIGLLCASQYVGSMVAISFGVPGESSSMPAVREGHALFNQGLGSRAIGTTAIGSFFGSLISIVIFFLILSALKHLLVIWNTHVQVVIFTIALFLVSVVSDNKWYVSLLFVILGIHFGLTGVNYSIDWEWATFDQPWLYSGLPMIPLLMGIFVVPELLKMQDKNDGSDAIDFKIEVIENIKSCAKNWWVIVYSSVVGFFCGLVPSLTTRLASNLTYMMQKHIELRNQTYKTGNISCLISAETSNNAATFSVLLPLLLLGIPITPSEFILYEYMIRSMDVINLDYIVDSAPALLAGFAIVNVICLIFAWPLANLCLRVHSMPKMLMTGVLAFMVLFPVVYTGWVNGLLSFYLGTFVFFATLGVILKKHDTMPIVFAFLISQEFIAGFYRFFQIHF